LGILEIASQRLFALDRLEQRLEITGAKALRAFALNDLVKQRRPVLYRPCEYLKQITFVIAVNENSELLKRSNVFVDLPDA
jgi:hypothetical protein